VELPRYARKDFDVPIDVTLPDGTPATLSDVKFALCPHGGPDGTTAWQDGSLTGAVGTYVGSGTLVGRDAPDKTGDRTLELTVARAELWGLPVQGGGVLDPWYIDTIETP
jgi:hypothetical protein